MLVLTRKPNQSIMIGDQIEISVLSIVGEKVRLGIQAPTEIPVFRTEIYVEIHARDGEPTRDPGKPRQEADANLDDAVRESGEL